jgi:hypothetical protein
MQSTRAALVMAVRCRPWVKASRAASSSPAPSRQTIGRRHGSSQGIVRRLRGFRRDAFQEGFVHAPAVDGRAQAAEDRDPEGPAELGAGLGDPRRGPGPLRWGGADDQVRAERPDRSEAGGHHYGAGHQDGQPGGTLNPGQHREAAGGERQAVGRRQSRAGIPQARGLC